MNDSDIDELRQLLLRQQAEMKALVHDSRDSSRPVELDQTTVGRVSRIDAIQGQQMAQETARRRGHQLEKIGGALRRIESGDYGCCYICGKDIDLRRLRTDPTLTRCIGCVDQ